MRSLSKIQTAIIFTTLIAFQAVATSDLEVRYAAKIQSGWSGLKTGSALVGIGTLALVGGTVTCKKLALFGHAETAGELVALAGMISNLGGVLTTYKGTTNFVQASVTALKMRALATRSASEARAVLASPAVGQNLGLHDLVSLLNFNENLSPRERELKLSQLVLRAQEVVWLEFNSRPDFQDVETIGRRILLNAELPESPNNLRMAENFVTVFASALEAKI